MVLTRYLMAKEIIVNILSRSAKSSVSIAYIEVGKIWLRKAG